MFTLIQAIARQEGYGVPRTLPTVLNNPGDIEWGKFARAHGGTQAGRFAHFPTPEVGFNALKALLISAYLGLTLEEALNKWAPPVENATNVYIKNVCEWTGLTPQTILTVENIS
jgi:hypothetical protein